jgi:hypothetical protein
MDPIETEVIAVPEKLAAEAVTEPAKIETETIAAVQTKSSNLKAKLLAVYRACIAYAAKIAALVRAKV